MGRHHTPLRKRIFNKSCCNTFQSISVALINSMRLSSGGIWRVSICKSLPCRLTIKVPSGMRMTPFTRSAGFNRTHSNNGTVSKTVLASNTQPQLRYPCPRFNARRQGSAPFRRNAANPLAVMCRDDVYQKEVRLYYCVVGRAGPRRVCHIRYDTAAAIMAAFVAIVVTPRYRPSGKCLAC